MTPFAQLLQGRSADELVALSHADRSQLEAALRLLANNPIRALEIGCYKGETTVWLLERGVAHVTVVDPFTGDPKLTGCGDIREAFDARTADWRKRVMVYPHRSMEALPELAACGRLFDLIYVDGGHDSRDVLFDAVLGFQLLRVGGVMVFDDYQWNFYPVKERNPGPAIDAFCSIYKPQIQLLTKGYQLSIRKASA